MGVDKKSCIISSRPRIMMDERLGNHTHASKRVLSGLGDEGNKGLKRNFMPNFVIQGSAIGYGVVISATVCPPTMVRHLLFRE